MLRSIRIQNIAIIDNAEIDFGPGLNVLSGETGAGKSIIVDALNILLGTRADRELVRHGAPKATVDGVLAVGPDFADIAEEGELVLSRELYSEGRSLSRMGGRPTPLSALREVTSRLFDVYGQHEHQTLLRPENHLRFLDDFASAQLQADKTETERLFKQLTALQKELSAYQSPGESRERRMDVLGYQLEEIEKTAPTEEDLALLISRRERLVNSERIREGLFAAAEQLNRPNPADSLRAAARSLMALDKYGAAFTALRERLESLSYEAEDAKAELSRTLEEQDSSSGELEKVEERLEAYRSLQRKFGPAVADVLAFAAAAQTELERLQNAGERVAALEAELAAVKESLYKQCLRLSELRRRAAADFTIRLQKEFAELGMPGARFIVQFAPLPTLEQAHFGPNGLDSAEFLFSANTGEPEKPLHKIISGGEMSRLMLAVKAIMGEKDQIDTMIFDEIDTGMSGAIATATAQKLRRIAAGRQVLCVTHLPQIAAAAHRHFFISKHTENGHTLTRVTLLSGEERVMELARLSGGNTGPAALGHARELLAQFAN